MTYIKLYLVFSFISINFQVFAVVAFPRKITYRLQNGKYAIIYLKGDETKKWASTEEGYTLLPDSIGWIYAQEDADGFAIASSFRLCAKEDISFSLQKFLINTPKFLPLKKNIVKHQLSIKNKSINTSSKIGNRKALVILMAFKDLNFKKSKSDLYELFNGKDYSQDGAQGSVHDYFYKESYGQLNLTCDVLGPYIASNNMNYYGGNDQKGNDKNPQAIFLEAIQNASKEINFSDYDSDGDGYVDNVHIIFAGYGEEAGASPSAIWSHETLFEDITLQNIKFNRYSCAPELRGNQGTGLSRIGTHCHEIGHVLGSMDFYDTDYSTNGYYQGTGDWDIMASGSWNDEGIVPADFNPYVKIYNFGWANVKNLPEKGTIELLPSNEYKDQIYQMTTPENGEYYLFENRSKNNYGRFQPGEGLLIYHIHKDISSSGNEINASYPQKCYIVCASSSSSIPTSEPSSFGDINSAGCPYPGTSNNTTFSETSVPSAFCWNGTNSKIQISNISQNNDGSISLYSGGEYFNIPFFYEGFEDSNFSSKWKNVQVQGSIAWNILPDKNNPLYVEDNLTPKAAVGDSYLCMKNNNILLKSQTSINRIESNFLSLKKDSVYMLSFQFQNRALQSLKGTLRIYYRLLANEEWNLMATYSDTSSVWIKREIPISESNPGQIQLAFEGELTLGGLYLDDIQISEKAKINTETPPLQTDEFSIYGGTKEICAKSDNNENLTIYTITGVIYKIIKLEKGVNNIAVPVGLYIANYQGKDYKILVY